MSNVAYLADYWTEDEDDLRFSDFRPALQDILMKAQTPLTVGVFGPWGSGKTSLLRMLRREVASKGLHFVRPVWFTAWKYDRHEALWRAFILSVLDTLHPREPGEGPREKRPRLRDPQGEQKDQVEILQQLEESVYRAVEWEELGRWTVNWWQMLQEGGEAAAEIAAAFLPGAAFFKKVVEVLGGDLKVDAEIKGAASAIRREAQAYHREHLTSMEQFEATFQEALRLILGDEGRLIIFVDDLDRCLPEKAVEVLEAIKLFLEVPGTVFVLGMDREVIKQGIETRYASLFHGDGEERAELPIRGDVYLQKIVQIPFHLPPLQMEDVDRYIRSLSGRSPGKVRIEKTTRDAFVHGLYPNPRQIKQALNIFQLLREIALAREKRSVRVGGLPKNSVAWPLLAKTVLIQTQWPDLYREWRQYPTLVQTLEAEYARRPSTEEDALRGRLPLTLAGGTEEEGEAGGLLDPYLRDRRKYALLERMLSHPAPGGPAKGRRKGRFEGLSRAQMATYVYLAGALEGEVPAVEVPADVMTELLSGDPARVQEAAARLGDEEVALRPAVQTRLQEVMRDPARPARERVNAGEGLAQVEDPRFRPDAWFLPNEPLLGFVEIPAGPFLMGTREDDIAGLVDQVGGKPEDYVLETPQHKLFLPAYYIGRYPVTVAQFRVFAEASDLPLGDPNSLQGLDNQPVTHVSWQEALHYCEWLTVTLRDWEETPEPLAGLLRDQSWVITLPSEAEWEKAASWDPSAEGQEDSDKKRMFPWGEVLDPERANYLATGIEKVNAVGCFSNSASSYGVEELSGNVWEWTRSLWGEAFGYPYDPADMREDVKADGSRVLRGGSFHYEGRFVRCACRHWGTPFNRYRSRGFRIVISPVLL